MRQARESAAGMMMTSERPGRGIWLWLLTVGLSLGPLVGLSQTYKTLRQAVAMTPELAMSEPWQSYVILTWVLSAGVLLGAWYGVLLISTGQHRGHIRQLIAVIWCICPGVRVIDIIGASILFGAEGFQSATSPEVLAPLGTNTLVALLWTLYLSNSRRVAERYPTGQ